MNTLTHHEGLRYSRAHRESLGLTQLRTARISGVSRFKLCLYESDNGDLTIDEHRQLLTALQREAERIRDVAAALNFGAATVADAPAAA